MYVVNVDVDGAISGDIFIHTAVFYWVETIPDYIFALTESLLDDMTVLWQYTFVCKYSNY